MKMNITKATSDYFNVLSIISFTNVRNVGYMKSLFYWIFLSCFLDG